MTAAACITIRPSQRDDVPGFQAIYAHHVLHGTASFETEPPDVAEMHQRRATVLSKGFPYLAAECDGAVIGYAYASTYRPRAAYGDTVENSIYLRPDVTGRGFGRPLLEALIAACEQCDLRQMIAVVGDSAHVASVRLHQRCGFHLVGVLRDVGWKHGRWLDSVLLQRSLGRGNTVPPMERR
ncbi:MAG TPA: GNAT family N-acetyltransferase [Acetobacteraceae bacterium]|nr:GNAT family N-acetyltransferase [Acetobacteraceae bacterium]